MPQATSSRSDYTGFMLNRTALAALLLTLASSSWAAGEALQDARVIEAGRVGMYDGAPDRDAVEPCEGEACRINASADGALKTGGLVVVPASDQRPAMKAVVPAPELNDDAPGAKDKPGFFKNLFSGKGLLYGLGGAAAGAGIGWLIGGPIGAIIGGLIGAVGGFFLSKMLAK